MESKSESLSQSPIIHTITQEQKEYISYNIKCFFEHYGLDEKIIKLNADCIILQKMTQDVSSFMDFMKKYPQYYSSSEHSRNKPSISNKANTISTIKSFDKKTHVPNISSSRLNTTTKKTGMRIVERALTTDKKTILTQRNDTHKKLMSKSPTMKQHSKNNSTTPSFSKGKSLRNIRNNKSNDFSQTMSFSHRQSKTNNYNTVKTEETKSTHSKVNTGVPSHIKTPQISSGNFNTVHHSNIKKTITPNKKINTPKKALTPALTPTRNRNTPKSKNTSTSNTKIGKTTIHTTSHKKVPTTTTPTTPKIGHFKDEANRSISPIENNNNTKELNKKLTSNQPKKNYNLVSKKKIVKVVNKKQPLAKQPKDITLNTSTENIESDDEQNEISEGILQAQKNKQLNTRINSRIEFSSNKVEALYLALQSNYFNESQKIRLIFSNPELYKNFSKKLLLKELISSYETKYIKCSEFLSKYDLNIINKPFIPTKTAQNGLNFITKDEEGYLIKKEQPQEMISLFTVIYVLLNENYEQIEPQKIISNLFTEIYAKYQVDTIKALFLSHIVKNANNLTQNQINILAKILRENPSMLSSTEILKINRSISYMIFIFKELFAFIFQKTQDGTFYYVIREGYKELNMLGEKIKRLKLFQ